jgi:hypothetical protein
LFYYCVATSFGRKRRSSSGKNITTVKECDEQPNIPKTEAGLLNIWRKVGDPVFDMRSDHITPVYYYTKSYMVNIDQGFWRNKDPRLPRDALIWFTDGSRDD